MKTLAAGLFAVALAAVPLSAGQEPEPVDMNQLMDDFARETASNDVHLLIVHLNDKTTDALFQPPQKYSLRAQARGQTMFFVQGTALRDATLELDFQLTETGALGVSTHRPRMISIQGMENGTELTEGDQFLGILALNSLLPLRSRLVLIDGLMRLEFEFSPNVLRQLQD